MPEDRGDSVIAMGEIPKKCDERGLSSSEQEVPQGPELLETKDDSFDDDFDKNENDCDDTLSFDSFHVYEEDPAGESLMGNGESVGEPADEPSDVVPDQDFDDGGGFSADDDDDEFGDFEAADESVVGDVVPQPLSEPESLPPIWERICVVGQSQESLGETAARKLDAATVIADDFGAVLWDPDQSSGFKFSWPKSLAWENLLSSLRMDARNAINVKSSKPLHPDFPAFAASLSTNPLEPMPANSANKERQIEAVSLMEPDSSTAIPPAEFDWAKSGLVNPLSEGDSPSADVRCELESNTPSPSIPVSAPLSVPAPATAPGQFEPPTLRKPSAESDKKSKDVNALILRIPDLSFMRSKILLFPTNTLGE